MCKSFLKCSAIFTPLIYTPCFALIEVHVTGEVGPGVEGVCQVTTPSIKRSTITMGTGSKEDPDVWITGGARYVEVGDVGPVLEGGCHGSINLRC